MKSEKARPFLDFGILLFSLYLASHASAKVRHDQAFGKLPLAFEANGGQTDQQVKFLARGNGYTLFLTPKEAVLRLATTPSQAKLPAGAFQLDDFGLRNPMLARWQPPDPRAASRASKSAVVRMRLIGANRSPEIVAEGELPGKANYFIGNDPEKWRTNVETYARVRYRQVYPGVDLVYYGNQRQIEHDFVVSPGSNPTRIVLDFRGADKLEVDGEGNLVLETAGGTVALRRPAIYQEIDGVRREISGGYVRKGARRVGFAVAAYDAGKPLIIDPMLVYSTYLGGSSEDVARGIAVDSSGNAYVAGDTVSTDFPTASPIQAVNADTHNAFVTKINAAGSALVYSTYLGGSSGDVAEAIAVDSLGNAYVAGFTLSTNFPTVNPIQAANAGGRDAFVAKINPAGSALVYSTYLGGSGDFDFAFGIAVDASDNAYVTGRTNSTNFPTVSPIQAANAGGDDAFVAKINAAGNALVYSTYLGGSGGNGASAIAVDSSGNAYVTGFTASTNSPTVSPIQAAFGGGVVDAFVTKINAAGSALVYSTYLGGSGNDQAQAIAVDSSGNAYVAGVTESTNFPTVSPIQAANADGFDAFVAKINAAGSALVYSTYLGGSQDDVASGIAVDSSRNAYVAGSTASTNFPAANPIQGCNAGAQDAFVAKINAAGSALVYSTYLGGNDLDAVLGIAVDSSRNAYVAGLTASTNFPTASPIQATYGGGFFDAFVAKIASTPKPIVPFAAFSPQAKITFGPPAGFKVIGSFTLGAGSNGINPPSEVLTLQVGTFSSSCISVGSFIQDSQGRFNFKSVNNGVSLVMQIAPLGGSSFAFLAEGSGANLAGTTNPVTIGLTIGDDTGSTTVTAQFF